MASKNKIKHAFITKKNLLNLQKYYCQIINPEKINMNIVKGIDPSINNLFDAKNSKFLLILINIFPSKRILLMITKYLMIIIMKIIIKIN